jgi:long-subunit acyl-CoA synthetase (AMP-forming)
VGKPIPGVRVDLDKTVSGADGETGEILVYGHCVMDGYNNLPEQTSRT